IVTSSRGSRPWALENVTRMSRPPLCDRTNLSRPMKISSAISEKNTITFAPTRLVTMASSSRSFRLVVALAGRIARAVVHRAYDEVLQHLVELLVLDHLRVPVVERRPPHRARDRGLLRPLH